MSWTRTHTCGALRASDSENEVILNGWVAARRNLGGLIFVDLRDRYGITQVVFPEQNQELHDQAEELRSEYVIGVKGKVQPRGGNINDEMPTGEIEVLAEELTIYSRAETTPFEIKDDITTGEELRMRLRYLDLRRPEMQKNMMLRSKTYQSVRSFFYDEDFAEIETPYLMRSTPEGARDYLVPSRVNPGKFFALPQSPQTYKQILMVSGYDRYFQIVKCFRDEDLRADRQPEFTQIDVELSFPSEELIYSMMERLMKQLFKETIDADIETPFQRLSYEEAIHKYGTDKPDLRYDMQIHNYNDLLNNSGFKIFDSTIDKGGAVVAINVPGEGDIGRGAIDRLTERVKEKTGAAGLIYIKMEEDGPNCSVGKFLEDETVQAMADRAGAEKGDLVLLLAGPDPDVYHQAGQLRQMMAADLELTDNDTYAFAWVTDFPLVEWDEDADRYVALHHPFTAPKPDDVDKMESDPMAVKAQAYDLVLNGYEIGGGSIRIHDQQMQERMFELLGIDEEEARSKFGFLLDAFQYGAPPHGGIAFGLDRIVMLLAGASSIREVIAFPKNKKAESLMDNSPSEVDPEQLEELHIKLLESAAKDEDADQ
ncbi:MAG: aspartate--tRNA ligase [Bacteroidota bacterium]